MIPQNANTHRANTDYPLSPAELRAASTDPEVIAVEAKDVLTPREAAAYLRASESWLKLMRLNGRGPICIQQGRYIRYRRVDILVWLMQNERRPNSFKQNSNKPASRAHG